MSSPVNTTTDTKSDIKQSDSKDIKYAVLMETSCEECESWYYFIKYNGNEKHLKALQEQLESIEWYIIDDLSTFDLDLEHLVSETTAKEMTKIELNHYSFHRKFDGILKKINLRFKSKDNNEKKISKVFDILGYGQIEDYIDKEDIDPEDMISEQDIKNNSESDKDINKSSDESESESNKEDKEIKNIPKSLVIPEKVDQKSNHTKKKNKK